MLVFFRFDFFEYSWIGLPLLIVTIAYMAWFGQRLLPVSKSGDRPEDLNASLYGISESFGLSGKLFLATITPDSLLAGKTLAEAGLGKTYMVTVMGVEENQHTRSEAGHSRQRRLRQFIHSNLKKLRHLIHSISQEVVSTCSFNASRIWASLFFQYLEKLTQFVLSIYQEVVSVYSFKPQEAVSSCSFNISRSCVYLFIQYLKNLCQFVLSIPREVDSVYSFNISRSCVSLIMQFLKRLSQFVLPIP